MQMSSKKAVGVWEPELEIPEGLHFDVDTKVVKKARNHYLGLSSIAMNAGFHNPDGNKKNLKVQSYQVPDGDADSMPDLSVELINQGLYYRANQFVATLIETDSVALGTKVTFTVIFYTRSDDEDARDGIVQSQTSFTLCALQETLILAEEEEEEEEEDEEEEDDEEGEEDEEDEEGEEGEAEEQEKKPRRSIESKRLHSVSRMRSLGLPRVGPGVDILDAGLEDEKDQADRRRRLTHRSSPYGVGGQSMHDPMRPQDRFPDRFGPSAAMRHPGRMADRAENDIVSLMQSMVDLSIERERMTMNMWAHLGAEMRASMQVQREQFSLMMEEGRVETRHARGQSNRANERLYEIANLSMTGIEGQAQTNRQGWEALQSGVQMHMNALENKAYYQQQSHVTQLQQMAQMHALEMERERERAMSLPMGKTSTSDPGRGKFVREIVAPIGGVILSEILKSRGKEGAAALIDGLLSNYGNEDEEEEAEEEAEVPLPPRPPTRKRTTEVPAEPPVHLINFPNGWVSDPSDPELLKKGFERLFREMPVVAMLRILRVWITSDQRKSIVEVLGEPAWNAMKAASEQKADALAIFKLQPLAASLGGEGIREKVDEILSAPQRELLNDLLTKIQSMLPSKPVVETTSGAKKTSKKDSD